MPLQSERAQTLLWAGVAIVLLWVLYLLGPVLTPFLAGAILAYILNPGVEWLTRHKWPRSVAAMVVILLTILAGILLVLILVPLFSKQVSELSLKVPLFLNQINEQLAPKLQEWFGVTLQLDSQSIVRRTRPSKLPRSVSYRAVSVSGAALASARGSKAAASGVVSGTGVKGVCCATGLGSRRPIR